MELAVDNKVIQIEAASDDLSPKQYIELKVGTPERVDTQDPFFVVDLGQVIELYRDWVAALPTVTPFYAVKCNEDPAVLKTLTALGAGFDCASKTEISRILGLGVTPDCIIYANPCKQTTHLKYAASEGVKMMTFDSEPELHKVHKHFPSARLVLRLKADDPTAYQPLGDKYGCTVSEGKDLLNTAHQLGLNVIGICFHVGSGAMSPAAYEIALKMAADLFAYGSDIGYNFTLLDIGGGFPGHKSHKDVFEKVAHAINIALETHFSLKTYPDLKIIAEPGRYFACSTHALAVNVIGKRLVHREEGQKFMYYISDGVFGSFNSCILTKRSYVPTPTALKEKKGLSYPSIIWGPTCDSFDKVGEFSLPELEVDDWLCFEEMGAYHVCTYSSFNGFLKAESYHYIHKNKLTELSELLSKPCAVSADHAPSLDK